ncbi:MAG: DUF5979 domain-containing protein [Christensenellales bacterium]
MAWVMTAAMLVSSCPTTAIAEEVVSQVQKPVAQTLRSGETYGSLQEAYKAEFETTDETHMSFENRVRDVEKNGKDTLIYANLRPAQNAAQWKTGEVVPFTLSMTFQLATNLTEYRAFDLYSMTFDEYIRYRPFDSYDDIRLQISAPGNLRISATDNGGWTDTLNVDSVQSVVRADGSNAVTLNYTFFGRMIDNGEHADGDLITPTVSLSASITPKMRYYDKNGELNDYAGTPIDYQATIHTNAFRNAAEAKTWDVQNEAVTHTVNGDEVTFTYQVRTGALGTQGEILRQNSDYVDHGVLDLSGYTLQETIQPVAGKNGAKVYPKQATVTLGDSTYTCDIVENGDGTRSLVMPANGGNTIHNTAALDGDNTVHPSVYAYNNYTVNLIYDRADFELDCDDERLDDAAFKGLGVTLDSTLNYTVYGDGDEKTADSSKTLYYHFVRQGGYILPEQYVKLAADVADRTAYSGSDAVFAIYKASEVTHNEKGELVLGEKAKLSDRIGAFETSRELPEGDYYVVRTGMEAGYTNVKPGDQTIKIGEAFYPYQLVTVKAGTEENAVKAEFEDYNAQNGQFILEKKFYAPDGTQDTNSSLTAEFTLTAQNGRTYTVKVENGKPTTVYLPADTYTMKETGVSDGFAKADNRIVLIEAGSQTRMTDDNAVKNYSTDGLLNLKAYLREYERGANLEADQSHYTVTITRDGETEPVKQTTLDEAESVYLPRFDGDGRLITYRVKVESNEQTDGLFYASRKNGEGEKPEAEIQITFTDDARIQNADYFFIKQQELTITKRLVDVSGLNKEQTWTITVQAACEAGDALPSRTVELTTDGEQNEASQTLSLRGWDENGHVVTYTVVEAAAEGYAVTYSEKSVKLDDGTGKTIIVTNTRQVGKTTFTKEGSDNATLPGAVYAVLTRKADGTTYLVGRTLTDGVLTEKTAAIVDEAGRLTQPENVADAYRFTTDADGRIELVLPVEEGTSYYLQELAAPENYYLNMELVPLTVAAGDDSQKAGQVDQRKYQLEVTKDFPDEVANGSFATFTLYDEKMQQVGEPVTARKPDQAVGVFTIPAYGTYYVRETAVSGDMMLNDSVFGPLTYSETNRADNPTVANTANVGSLTVELRDEKKEKLGTQPAAIDYVNAADLAKFTVSVDASNLAENSYAYRALLGTGFVLDETTNTLVYTGEKGASQAFELSSLPIYGDPNDKTTALTYTVKQEQAAQRYFKAEDGQQFKLDKNASQTLTFKNEPKAALNVSLNYKKEYELKRDNAPEYPLTGATMTLYEVKDNGALEQVKSFNMTNPTETISDLHGLKHYVLVETEVPDGYCAYQSEDSVHEHSKNAEYNNREPRDYQDVLVNFKYVELTGEETDNQNDKSNITNYKDYVQLKLNKIGYTVQFADGAATEGVVVDKTQRLDYCQFEVYAIRTSDLTEEQRKLLDRNRAFKAPQAGDTVKKGEYTGREAELEAIFTAEPQKSKLITDGITYETGASGMGTGAFMTDAFDLGDDVGEYTFLFREVKINHAGGYQKVYGGVWSAAATKVNAVTKVDAYNEADVTSGGGTEFKGLFQVKLDKEYWSSTEAKDKNLVDKLRPLAGVTFELLLARENANGLLEAVTGSGAFSTEFVTGCESGMSASYGVSITVSLETLYTENGGAANPDNPVKLDVDENGQPFYEADFILREKDYPINMVYMQEQYALHVKAVKNAQDADYVTVADDYLNKDGQDNAIKNILGEMTYLTVAKYVDGKRYYGGEGSTDAVYTITDAKGNVYTHVTLNNANHYETTVQLPRQTKFTIEETTAPVIEGVQTDKSGFVFDGENVNGTSANRLTFTTGEYKSQIAVCSTNTRFHSLTVIKRDAAGNLVEGAPIQIGYSDGESAVLSSNESALANTRQTTNEKGEVIFSLPIWDYRTSEAGNYPQAEYAIAETLDETPVAANWNPNAVVNRYFKLLNGGKLTIAGADVEADEPITVYNPATTSVTLHKVSDRSGDTADLKPIAADFALYFCPFKSQDEFEGKLNYPKIGYVYLPHTGTTDAETGKITFDGLYSGWYKLVETIPQGQVNAGQLFTTWFRVICDEDYEHLDKSGKSKSYTSEVQLFASATLKNRSDAGRQDANNSVTITDHTIDVTNTPRAYLEITKTFEPSQTQSIPESVAFYVYKKGTTEAAELEMRVVDAHGTESWQKVAQQPITLGGFTETERSQSVVVRLDPGAYTVVESMDESVGYWFAKSAAYLNGNPETPVYNGTTVANGRITSSRDVTVTRYNAMDVQRQLKVDFVNAGTLMAGQIEKTRRLSESETPTALENCFFSLYTLDEQNNKRYYAGRESGTPFGDWTGARENAARFKSGADGMVQLNEVYAPEDAMTDGTPYTYYVEEISAPNYSYQLAYDAQIDLAAGSVANTISMVNTRGVSVQVRVFGSVRSNRDDDTPVVEGAVLRIMKKDADGELHEVLLSDGQPYLYQTVTSDANGDVLFPYLPRLEEGEAYVVFEQPDAGAIGDDPAKPYLNPVSQGYKAYYDFKKTDANHSTAEQDVSELDGAAGYYTVVTGEELMANPNELFSTLHFNAYNEPKGRLVILKRDYENKSALVVGAKFSAAETDGMDETHSYAFANLEPTAADRTEAPQTLEIGEKTYTLAKDRTYYTDEQGYRYTYVITSYVESGNYAFAETTTPADYIETEASQSAGMPWHTKAEAVLTNKGGFAAAAFANIPNRDPYLDKTVSAVNGEAGGKLGNLQNTQADGSWQTVTFEIRKTTSDSGAADANDAIRYPMSSFVITDNKVEYQTVDALGNKSGWLDGGAETVQTQHFVEGVTVGKMSFAQLEEAYGTAAEGDRIYADVYGLIGTQETLIQSNIDVTDSGADVSLKAEDGGCIYTGFKIAYHMQDGRDIPAGLRQDTPIVVTMRFHQESGEAIDRVCGVRNTAGLNLAYAIGAKSQESVSKTYTDAANRDADSSIGLPKARITKQVQRAEIVQNPNTGDYVVNVEAEATNPKSNSLTVSAGSGAHYTIVFENISGQAENLPAIEAPILVDTLPRQAMAVKAEATSDNAALKLTTTVSQDGYTVVVRGDGRLEAGQKITLTVDALFVGERILEQIIAHNTGMDANIAYAMSGVQTVKNTKNPFGVPFVDEAGNEITGMVKQQPGDSQSGELPGFEGQHGISAKAVHRSAEPSALTISKYVAGTITGKDKFVSGSNVAVTGAKTEKDNEINRIYYRILVENPTLSPAANVAVMDELPHTDDWRNDSSTRDSKWDVALESTAISVTKYAADGSSTELKPGEDYTVYFTQKKITSQNRNTYNDYFDADNIRNSWATSMAPADVHGFAVMLTQPLAGKERVLIEYTCSAPEVTDSSVYFTTANNIARLSYDQHSGVASDVARVAIIPEKVWLGNRVWIDFNGDGIQSEDRSVEPNYAYTGEGKQLTMQLSQRYNRYRPTTQTQTITDGSYQFDELFAAVKLASLKNDPNDSAGDVVATNLSGSERYTYQLTLSGIPESFMVTRKSVNNPIASDEDSDFVAKGNGGAATKWFYLPVPTEEMVKNNQLGYPQVDVGLVPVRNLEITKKADNNADVSDAVFAIYGPYTTEELANLTAVSPAKKVGEMTSSSNVYRFVSTQSAYLTYADNYLVVETSAPAPYLSTGATFSGKEGIAPHGEVEIDGEKHSCFVLEGMNTLPGDFKADSRKTYYVDATDLYSAAGTYMLTAQKKVFDEGTQVELERYANLFRIRVTSPNDPNLTKRVAAGGNVTVEGNAVFVQADENGKFDLTMNYATIPETGWTQRDWEGMTYAYQIEEVDTPAFDGVTYDKTKYTVTVTLEDDGQGHLTPKAEISDGEDGSIVLKNELARRDLTISKTTTGNAVLSDDAFTVKIRLSRNDIVPVDGDYPMDGAAETTLTVKNGEATLTIRDGQTVTIKEIPVGTAYTVEETDERAQGYNIDASAYMSGGSGVIATDKEAKVELKNVRNAGSLAIRKKIEGKDPISEREFSFTAAITYPAGVDLSDADNLPKIPMGSPMTVEDRTVTIQDIRIAVSQTEPDVSVTIDNILYGASYTVTENDGFAEWGYAAYYDEDMKFGASTTNRVVNAENQTALFTNVRSAGKLKIGKTATGTGVGKGLAADTETYDVTLTLENEKVSLDGHVGRSNMPSEGEKTTYPVKQKRVGQTVTLTLSLHNGEVVTFEDLPEGTRYVVVEDEQTYRDMGFTVSYADGNSSTTEKNKGTISKETASSVQITNVRDTHSVSITKNVLGQMANEGDAFDFNVKIEKKDDALSDAAVYRAYTYTVNGQTATIDFRRKDVQTISLKKGETAVIDDVPDGADIIVTEAMSEKHADEGYTLKTTQTEMNEKPNIIGYTFTNERYIGSIEITKALAGTGSDKGYGKTFTFDVKLWNEHDLDLLNAQTSTMPSGVDGLTKTNEQRDGHDVYAGTVSITMGADGQPVSASITNIPAHTSYEIVERDYTDDGYTTQTPQNASGLIDVVNEAGREEAMTFTNTRESGTLALSKALKGNATDSEKEFTFRVKLENARFDTATQRDAYDVVIREANKADVQTTVARDANGEYVLTLKGGQTATLLDVLYGTTATVAEDDYTAEGYEAVSTQTAAVNGQTPDAAAAFTNERYIGSIEITKALAGTGSDKGYGKTFTFDVKLWNEHDLDLLNAQTSTMPSGVDGLTKTNEQRDGHDVYAGTVSITMGADGQPVSASITNIPAHTRYEIVERDYTDDGYTTQTPQNASGLIDVVNEAGREEAMTFTNTRESGTLALSKALKGNATDSEKEFTFRVKLENAQFDTATQRDAYDVVIREANKADVQTTVARDANGEYVLTLKGGQTATLLDVLYGTTATVAEDDYTAEGYEAVSTQTAAVNSQTPDAAAAFTNERNVGVLSVTKNAVGNAVKFEKNGRAVFSFSATLTYADWIDLTQTNNLPTVDGKTPKNMTVDAKNHTVTLSLSIPVTEAARVGSLNVENILKGTRYAVREVFDTQDGYYLTVSTQNGRVNGSEVTGTIADALTGDAVFTNTRNVGALEITKKLEGTGYNDRVAVSNAVRTSFGFTVRLWREDGVRLTGDNRPTLNGKALTLETRTENGFTYDEAHVTVDMADGAAATGEERGVTIGNILVDTHYTVIEDENGYQTEGYVVRQGEQGGVMTDAGDTLRFVNTRDTGSLEIVKNLDGGTAEFGREFEFTVTLSRNDNIALAGTYLTQSGRTVAFEDNAAGGVTARVRVAGGGSLTILGIPSGTSYTVSEADYTADRYTTTSTGAVGVVETAAVRATFLNTRANPGYGALTVTKTVEAIGGAEIPDTQFVFDIALTLEDGEDFTGTLRTTRTSGETGRLYFNGGAASIRLSHGESVTLSGIPLGTSYTVTERAAQDMRVSSTGSEGAITGTGHMAAFVNTMTQAYTDLIVRKAWNDANDAQKLRPQSVTVDVTRNGQTITTLTLNAANRWTQTLTQLPMFDDNGEAYDYDVVENDVPEGYTASVVTRGTTFTVINTHRIDDGFVPVDPENRRRGGLTILDDLGVPLGGSINMNEGDCFN